MLPVRTWLPPKITTLAFVPLMAPAKVSAAAVIVRVLEPKAIAPALLPPKLTIETPLPVTPLISKVALLVTLLAEIVPLPERSKLPAVMVVVPV